MSADASTPPSPRPSAPSPSAPSPSAPSPSAPSPSDPSPLSRVAAFFAGVPERLVWGGMAALAGAAMTVLLFSGPPQIRLLETTANDALRVVIAPRMETQEQRISIVALTEETLVQFPYRSPVDRGFLARLMDALAEAGAKAVVLDLIFDQPTEPAKDAALIEAIRRFPGPVVAAWGDEAAGFIESQSRYILEYAEKAELSLGFAHLINDSDDGVVRRFATRLPGIERLSMSGTMAEALTGETPMEDGVIDWRLPKAANATLFQQWPANRLLTFAERPATKAVLERALKGRVVFVGADLEQRDRHQTPLAIDPDQRRTIPGVLIQATVLSQLLDKRVVPNAGPTVAYGVLAAMAALGALIGLLRINLLWKAAAAFAGFAGYIAVVYGFAASGALFLPVATAASAMALAFILSLGLENYLTSRKERFIRRAFSHYLEPTMVDQLANDPQSLRLGGDRREMSLIFTDITGFTQMAEKLSPDRLTALLNDYFDGMSDIILAHGGAIDKFIGDAVVAHFGAPRRMEDHALKALLCAAALDRFAEGFRKANAHLGLGVTRIGVHSGVATVGNFGGRARFDYTAMGDAVNTTARLESANKRYGTRVGVSQETAEIASAAAGPEDVLPRLQTIGKIALRGKAQPVTVYTVNNDAPAEFIWAYEAAFSMIENDLRGARAAFEALRAQQPDDPLVNWHLGRFAKGDTGVVVGAA